MSTLYINPDTRLPSQKVHQNSVSERLIQGKTEYTIHLNARYIVSSAIIIRKVPRFIPQIFFMIVSEKTNV